MTNKKKVIEDRVLLFAMKLCQLHEYAYTDIRITLMLGQCPDTEEGIRNFVEPLTDADFEYMMSKADRVIRRCLFGE